MKNTDMEKHKEEYTAEIASVIFSLSKPTSVLEAGVGEATTLAGVLKNLGNDVESYGFMWFNANGHRVKRNFKRAGKT